MERVETQKNEDNSQPPVDLFLLVMGPKHPGHV